MIEEDFSEEINKKIEDIQKRFLAGKLTLLDLELAPLFNELENTLSVYNLNKYSKSYKYATELLSQKFNELKNLLSSLDTEKKFMAYLKSNPDDSSISDLMKDCWREPFNIYALSLGFLEDSKNKLSIDRSSSITIEHLDKLKVKNDFLLEIPRHNFTEKMTEYFNGIKDSLPCSFNDIFAKEKIQEKIYEKFVYLLHLLQLGKIKYENETKTLYI